jgi:hypothetical protein
MMNAHLHLEPRLRISGAILLLLLHAFIQLTKTSLRLQNTPQEFRIYDTNDKSEINATHILHYTVTEQQTSSVFCLCVFQYSIALLSEYCLSDRAEVVVICERNIPFQINSRNPSRT